jgi:glycosyltransferase involved in cell wall biosynthesis
MQKIACVFSFRESSWVSCQKIVFNLHKAYEIIPKVEILNFDYGHESWGFDLHALVNGIFEAGPDAIVILDHKPHPIHFLKHLLPKYEGRPKPRLVFHVFGDFTLFYSDWAKLGPLLAGFPVEFIVASDRQKNLIDKFLLSPHSSHVCPFPVKKEDFHFHPEERIAQRKAWGVDDREIVFTFTGRISRQKRTHLLLKSFDEALRRVENVKARLYIYGQPDHIGDQFLNVWENENEYFRRIHRQYRELPESSRSRIHFMGNVPNSELRTVYAGADYLVNLSVHNDEDYGMSVAEAQMTGLPAILSDWGGLASFKHPALPEATRFLKVSLGLKSKIISFPETVTLMSQAMKSPRFNERVKLSQLAKEKFSVEEASARLEWIYGQKSLSFVSFSELLMWIANRILLGKGLYMTKDLKISNTYRKLYSSYVRNS